MLVMRRRVGQVLLIAGGVHIEVLEASGNKVKLGITAPKDIAVTRMEAESTRKENFFAAHVLPEAELAAVQNNLSQFLGLTATNLLKESPNAAIERVSATNDCRTRQEAGNSSH